MTFNEYQDLARTTRNPAVIGYDIVRDACYGLNGEAGECIDILKKHEFQGHSLAQDRLVDEAGDVLWYLAELADGLDMTLEEIAAHNLMKLKERYPEGFSTYRSVHRRKAIQNKE